jgi:UTP--glucose-1-phosphate uridylyltransferase
MATNQKIKKAVIAAAGFGTRFLPQTKAMPKEMLPLVDKPIIQYVVEELVDAGIKDIIIVTGYNKRNIEDHFDSPNQDLINNLKTGGKEELLEQIEAIANMANFIYVRQKGPYGNGTPILNAESLISDEPFIYTWSDDFIAATPNRFKQLIDAYNKYECSILASIRAQNDTDYSRYGFAGGKEIENGVIDVEQLIEKPGKSKAPSDLATVSGYIFTPDIFGYLYRAQEELTEKQELYYNDALKLMLKDKRRIIAYEVKNGKYYDAGNKLEYLKTVVDFALLNEEVKDEFKEFLRGKIT